jgi:hypothetical protein
MDGNFYAARPRFQTLNDPVMDKITTSQKPARFIKPLPHLPVKDLQQTLDYYHQKLGFSNQWTFGDHDGGISRDALAMLFAEDKNFTNNINNKEHRLPILWFVHNIATIFTEFKDRGIEFADELRTHPYGLREFAFIDINGYYIRVAEDSETAG